MEQKPYVINEKITEIPNTDNPVLRERELEIQVQDNRHIRSVHVVATSEQEGINARVIVGVDSTAVFIDSLGYWVRIDNKTGEAEKINRRY